MKKISKEEKEKIKETKELIKKLNKELKKVVPINRSLFLFIVQKYMDYFGVPLDGETAPAEGVYVLYSQGLKKIYYNKEKKYWCGNGFIWSDVKQDTKFIYAQKCIPLNLREYIEKDHFRYTLLGSDLRDIDWSLLYTYNMIHPYIIRSEKYYLVEYDWKGSIILTTNKEDANKYFTPEDASILMEQCNNAKKDKCKFILLDEDIDIGEPTFYIEQDGKVIEDIESCKKEYNKTRNKYY